MVPVEDFAPLRGRGHLPDEIPHAVVPIAQTGHWVCPRLLIDPADQSLIVLKPGPDGLVVQTDPFIIPPNARFAQRRSPSNLATIHAQFLDTLILRKIRGV